MSAVSIGSLLSSSVAITPPKGPWRGSYHITDDKAKVGRPFGDGSNAQRLAVIDAIVKTAKAWSKKFKTTTDFEPRVMPSCATTNLRAMQEKEQKKYLERQADPTAIRRLTNNMIETLYCIFNRFMDAKTGNCEATYEMIMAESGFARRTVIRHIKALRALGWLNWVRRTTNANGRNEQTANNYFFEISNLPLEAQIDLRQKLDKRSIELKEHEDRQGSAPIPSRAVRLAQRIAQGMRNAANTLRGRKDIQERVDEAAFIRGEMELMGDIPTDQWAAIRYPDDAAAQRTYCARLDIPFFDSASVTLVPHSRDLELR